MSDKLRRWLILGMMIFGIIPFVGASIVPLIQAFQQGSPGVSATSAQVQATAIKEELQARANGFELVLQREPDNQVALRQLIATRQQMAGLGLGDIKDAIAPMEKLASLNPKDVGVQIDLASFYTQQKRYDEAIALLDKAIDSNKKDFRPVFAKAIVLQQQGKTEQAQPLFASAADLAPPELKERVKAQIAQIQTQTSAPKPDSTTSPSTSPSTDSSVKPAATPSPESTPAKN
ncbi:MULTISPECIES: tetratricopeptide repeat protein [Aerosakkonema]|uniref:tetratricopeptide repeat protein n=1 Tax=Aerosakkonema TaxID=1246629 RepID=UPI0035B9400F